MLFFYISRKEIPQKTSSFVHHGRSSFAANILYHFIKKRLIFIVKNESLCIFILLFYQTVPQKHFHPK